MATQWERLHLSKEESSFFHANPEQYTEEAARGKYCLVGKALTEKSVNSEGFRVTMSQIWKLDGWVKLQGVGRAMFSDGIPKDGR